MLWPYVASVHQALRKQITLLVLLSFGDWLNLALLADPAITMPAELNGCFRYTYGHRWEYRIRGLLKWYNTMFFLPQNLVLIVFLSMLYFLGGWKGCVNLPFPVPCTPSFYPVHYGSLKSGPPFWFEHLFVLFLLKLIMQCCNFFSHLTLWESRFPPSLLPPPVDFPSPLFLGSHASCSPTCKSEAFWHSLYSLRTLDPFVFVHLFLRSIINLLLLL